MFNWVTGQIASILNCGRMITSDCGLTSARLMLSLYSTPGCDTEQETDRSKTQIVRDLVDRLVPRFGCGLACERWPHRFLARTAGARSSSDKRITDAGQWQQRTRL